MSANSEFFRGLIHPTLAKKAKLKSVQKSHNNMKLFRNVSEMQMKTMDNERNSAVEPVKLSFLVISPISLISSLVIETTLTDNKNHLLGRAR